MNTDIDLLTLTELAKTACFEAGEEILKIYNSSEFGIEIKKDNSPLTLADKAAHKAIVKVLEKSKIPILSEEGQDISYEIRKKWEYFWMIDPLDGTKEFIKKNGEFTVNIALIHQNQPVIGVVYAPVLNIIYWGNPIEGAWKQEGKTSPIQLKKPVMQSVKTIVASRSHLSHETQQFIDQFENTKVISMGSSLKFMLLAENKAQLYPRFAPTMEWDTAAAHGVIAALGGKVIQWPEKIEMYYNKENLLNPWFLAQIIPLD